MSLFWSKYCSRPPLIWLTWSHPSESNDIASYRSQYLEWNIFGEFFYDYGKSSPQEEMTAVRARFCLFLLYSSICLSALYMYEHAFAWVTLISMQFTWFVTNIDNTVYYGTYFNNITLHIAYFLVMGYFLLLHALPRYIWSVTTGGYCQSRHISYSNKAGQPRILW